jgi:hypothetical protein
LLILNPTTTVVGVGIMNGEWQVYDVTSDKGLAFAVGDQLGEPIVSEGELVGW